MIKKIKLDYSPEYDFIVIAILSFEKDYKLVWDINNSLAFDFLRTDDYKAYNKKRQTEQEFSTFIFHDEKEYVDYQIITNKSDQGYLLEELKNIDFLMLIKGDFEDGYDKIFQSKLQNLQSVQSAFILDVTKIKAKERLMND